MIDNQPRKVRVLVVDDSSTIRIAASKIFGQEFDVLLAVDGEDALNVIENDKEIQVVFTDLVMPEMDGFELLKTVRTHQNEHISQLPVIVTTGAENPEVAKQKAFSIGATDFITKPFVATDIRARARSYAQLNNVTKTLKKQTTLDILTGLLNRRGFRKQLDKEIAFASRHDYNLSVINIELDNYKSLFIKLGRNSTELIIKRIANAIEKSLRKEDTIARTSLAKFSISMPLAEKETALEMANKLCERVESFRATQHGKRLKLTVSAGVFSCKPGQEYGSDMLIEAADAALREAAAIGPSQIYLLSLHEFHQQFTGSNGKDLSIDELLNQVNAGEEIKVASHLEMALERLGPLFALLSNEQKQRIFNYR